jgi:hypothetical protein
MGISTVSHSNGHALLLHARLRLTDSPSIRVSMTRVVELH